MTVTEQHNTSTPTAQRRDPKDDVGSGFPVTHSIHVPVHIIGHGRSGTSIFSALCRKYLGIARGTESQFIIRYYRRLHRYGDLTVDANARRLIAHITSERFFQRSQKFGYRADADEIFETLPERTYRGVLEAIFMQLARQLGMDRWGDKSPEYVHHLPVLGELFPDAQYIHIVRDGRDMAMSAIRNPKSQIKNIHRAALDWRDSVDLVREFRTQFPASQFHEIRYEDLLSEPVTVFQGLIDFLGIVDQDGALIDFIAENIGEDLMSANHGKWRTQMSEADRHHFELTAGDVLRAYRYETVTNELQQTSRLNEIRWAIDNQVRRWMLPGFWADNAYRASLRVADLVRSVRPPAKAHS